MKKEKPFYVGSVNIYDYQHVSPFKTWHAYQVAKSKIDIDLNESEKLCKESQNKN